MTGTKFEQLRHDHPKLVFSHTQIVQDSDSVLLQLHYRLEPDRTFVSTLKITSSQPATMQTLSQAELEWWSYQIGLVELLSYWKATCSPVIEVVPLPLSSDQIQWWHTLLKQGLGEFFYTNQINLSQPDLVRWQARVPTFLPAGRDAALPPTDPTTVLVPLGGGKDSLVTQDLLLGWASRTPKAKLGYLLVNPTQAALTEAELRPADQTIIVERTLDPGLIEMNEQGYWNGHTPFSALVAMISGLTARLYDYQAIAVSNERSSNEGNVIYHGLEINHQFSKTFQFENSLHHYWSQSFSNDWAPQPPWYFSMVRPWYELQIARVFSQVLHQHPELTTVFRSCNRGQKTNTWCGQCPKCLFATIILSPFLSAQTLTTIFGHNLLEDLSLEPVALELLGKTTAKPFECVGTYQETAAALYLTHRHYTQIGQPIPALLARLFETIIQHDPTLPEQANALLTAWNNQHSVPTHFVPLLTDAL